MIKKSFKDMDKKMLSMMTLPERFKYINEQKRKRFNPTTEEKNNKEEEDDNSRP